MNLICHKLNNIINNCMGKKDIKNNIGGDYRVNDLVVFSFKIINFFFFGFFWVFLLFLFKALNKDFFIYFFKNFFI